MSSATRFDADTAVAPAGEGRRTAEIPARRFNVDGPNGGCPAAILVRAMEADLALLLAG